MNETKYFYDVKKGVDLGTLSDFRAHCSCLFNFELFGGSVYQLRESSKLFKKLIDEGKVKDKPLNLILKKGAKATITDFSILLGGASKLNDTNETRTGKYWIIDEYGGSCIDENGEKSFAGHNDFKIGTRPAVNFKYIAPFCENPEIDKDGFFRVEFGEYPQDVVNKQDSKTLDELYKNKVLNETGRKFTINTATTLGSYSPMDLIEYTIDNRKFIRVKPKCHSTLSNGQKCNPEEYVWIEVKPITWITNAIDGTAVTEKIMFAGIDYDQRKQFLPMVFCEEILENIFYKRNKNASSWVKDLYLANYYSKKL